MSALHRIGADENGLGPRLGPLVVTAVLARVTEEGARLAGKSPRGALSERLGDSKALLAHGDVALGEAWARAVVEREGLDATSPDAVVHALSLEPKASLRAACPPHVEAQCWTIGEGGFEAPRAMVDVAHADLARLAARGVDVRLARTTLVCTKRLNDARTAGRSRFDVDLHAMESLVLALRELAGGEVDAVCGKVGGYARYGAAFGPLAGRLFAVEAEGPASSAYRFPGLGRIAFVRDADDGDLVVALASMIGKWVREATMESVTRHYGPGDDGLPRRASGYHDPVTAAFVEATRLVRRERGVPDACFERERADEARRPRARAR